MQTDLGELSGHVHIHGGPAVVGHALLQGAGIDQIVVQMAVHQAQEELLRIHIVSGSLRHAELGPVLVVHQAGLGQADVELHRLGAGLPHGVEGQIRRDRLIEGKIAAVGVAEGAQTPIPELLVGPIRHPDRVEIPNRVPDRAPHGDLQGRGSWVRAAVGVEADGHRPGRADKVTAQQGGDVAEALGLGFMTIDGAVSKAFPEYVPRLQGDEHLTGVFPICDKSVLFRQEHAYGISLGVQLKEADLVHRIGLGVILGNSGEIRMLPGGREAYEHRNAVHGLIGRVSSGQRGGRQQAGSQGNGKKQGQAAK